MIEAHSFPARQMQKFSRALASQASARPFVLSRLFRIAKPIKASATVQATRR
jgi:hypothetical protein